MTLSHMDGWDMPEQDRLFSEAMERDRSRLRGFIRRYVADSGEAEDILQDVFFELLEAYRMMKPIEHVSGWLFRVARNRIVDLFRRRRTQSLSEGAVSDGENPPVALEDLLPSAEDGPDAAYARKVLLEALEDAIDELPPEQREIFVAHEVVGTSFKEYAAETGIGRATLYKYFSDVEAILVAWHERQISGHLDHLAYVRDRDTDPGERLRAVFEAYALIHHELRVAHGTELAALLHSRQHVSRAQRRLSKLVRDLLAEAISSGEVRDDVAHDELVSYSLHALAAASILPSKAAVHRLVTLTLAGLRPAGRRHP